LSALAKFLQQITIGDDDLIAYLQRIAGYALTGLTTEQAMFFLYGTGGNGKGVFLNCLTAVMGSYATVAPAETFLISRSDRHPTDVAGLRGARFVTAQEIEDGQQWAEAKIKSLTGGDPISARFMRQDYFTFQPQFKLFVAGNNKPSLRNVDPAIRRRINLIPFKAQIPLDQQDRHLTEKLKAEWPGILRWCVDGCLAWQRDGLQPPSCVVEATDRYLEAQDARAAWLEENGTIQAGFQVSKADVRDNWAKWCERARHPIGGRNDLFDWLENQGFEAAKGTGGKRIFRGFALRAEDMSGHYWNG
jgi:putative DNA primase/helicase